VLRFPAGSVLLVAGIPGAGKSTLIGRLFGSTPSDVLVLDSADVRAAFARRLGPALPYRLYRPLVHTAHYARIAAWVLGPRRNLVVHECGTRDWVRRTVTALAALRLRPAHLLFLDTPPELALAGQRSRGRMIPTRPFRRHSRQSARLRRAIDAATAGCPPSASGASTESSSPASPADRPASTPAGTGRLPRGRVWGRVRGRVWGWGWGWGRDAAPDLRREGWASALRLSREQALHLTAIRFDG
jgi:hypothetical protein